MARKGNSVDRWRKRETERKRDRKGETLNHLSIHQCVRSAIFAPQQLTSPIGFSFLNFRHRLVRYYWYWIYCGKYIRISWNININPLFQQKTSLYHAWSILGGFICVWIHRDLLCPIFGIIPPVRTMLQVQTPSKGAKIAVTLWLWLT